jgi:photosystem II stability/assembly factor-like uncharacterized protein
MTTQQMPGGVNVFTSSGPEGGTISAIAINGSNGTVFAATGENVYGTGLGGVFRRSSGASRWERTGLVGFEIPSLRVSPKDPNLMWAATTTGLYRSADAGGSWTAATDLAAGTQIFSVVPDASDIDVVYVSTPLAIMKSTNGGKSWAFKTQGLPRFLFDLEPDRTTGTLYAWTSGVVGVANLFFTANGGESWSPVSTPSPDNAIGALAVDPARATTLYISMSSGSVQGGAYRSTDGGSTWAPLGIAGFQTLVVSPRDPHTLFVAAQGRVFESTDDGKTFVGTSDPLPLNQGSSIVTLAVAPSGAIYAVSRQNGMFQSEDDGATWRPMVEGLVATDVCSVTADPTSPKRLYAGTPTGLFASADGGESWGTAMGPADPLVGPLPVCNLVVDPGAPQNLVAVGSFGSASQFICRSTDFGLTWMKGKQVDGPAGLAFDPGQPATLYLADNLSNGEGDNHRYLVKSVDGGITWSSTELPGAFSPITAFLLVPGSPTTLIAGSNGHVLISTDGGSSWVDRSIDFEVDAIAADPSHPGWLYAGGAGGSGLAFSADGGLSWAPRNQGLPPAGTFSISALTIDPSAPSSLFASLRLPYGARPKTGGPAVFRSGDGGLAWIPFSAGLVNSEGTSLIADKSRLVVGTPGSGVWLLTFGHMVVLPAGGLHPVPRGRVPR